jgi:hypothetical protein
VEVTKDQLASLGEAVLALAGQILPLVGPRVAGITSVGVEAVYVPNQGDWTQDMVVRLKKSLTYPAAITLLDMAAAKPNKEIKFPEIGARSGLSDKQVAAELGAMSKLSRKLFDGQKIWPIRWWQDASDNITRYVMHPRIAEWWRAA